MTYADRALRYAEKVVAGGIPACCLHRLACERQVRDLKRSDWVYRYDAEAANRVCQFIELLPHIKGEWARPKLIDGVMQYPKIKLEDWQCFILCTVFGWQRMDNGRRRFTRVYEEVPRKNAKSTKVAGVGLYMFAADDEPGAECYSVATTGEQARIVWGDASKMAEREPEFRALFGVELHAHDIAVPETASVFRPLNAEGSTLDGLNIHFAAVDEFHAHKRRNLYDVIDSATGARSQPLIWMVTTAGSDRSGICYEQRTHLVKILECVVEDETFFGIIFSADDDDDWTEPSTWAKANPNFGVSVLPEDMEAACRKAMSMPSAVNNFLTKRLNIWVNADSAWMDMRAWDECSDPALHLDDFAGEKCWIGMDLAEKQDFAALCLVFERGGKHFVFPRLYINAAQVEDSGNSQYSGWDRAGHIIVNEGNATDFDVIADDLRDYCKRFDVQEIPFDPALSMYFAQTLMKEGMPLVEITQGYKFYTQPLIQTENLVLERKLVHTGNPAMTWMISNVVATTSKFTGLKHPTKERPENKIDGPVAMFMALGRAITPQDSVGEDELNAYLKDGMRST